MASPNSHLKSSIYMSLCAFFFCIMAALVKATSRNIPLFEIIFFRGLLSTLFLIPLCWHFKLPLRGNNQRLLVMRGLFGFTALIFNFFALSKISLVNESVLRQTTPIFVILLSLLIFKERFFPSLLIFILIAVFGIILILKPQNNFANWGSLSAIFGAFLAACAYLSIRQLHSSEETPIISLYFSLVSAVAALPFLLWHWETPDLKSSLALLGIGISGTLGQLTLTHAYKYSEASWVTPFTYLQVPFSLVLGILFFKELPDLLSFGGLVLTMASCLILVIIKTRMEKKDLVPLT